MMAATVHWAKYERPLPADYPIKHFQQSRHEWKECKWSGARLSCREWSPIQGLLIYHRDFSSEGHVQAHLNELAAAGFTLARQGDYPAGPIDYNQLKEDVKRYAVGAYEFFLSTLDAETMVGFALVSDGGAMTLDARMTTLEGLKVRHQALSEEEAFFLVAEWPRGDDRRIELPFMDTMNSKRDWDVPFDRQISFQIHKKRFFGACVAALEDLRHGGMFPDQENRDFLIMFEVMDDNASSGRTFLRLNPKRLLGRYKRQRR